MSAASRTEEGFRIRRAFALLRLAPSLCIPREEAMTAPSAAEIDPLASADEAADPECIGRKRPFRVDVPALFLQRAAEFCADWRTPKRDSLEPPTVAMDRAAAAERSS